MGRIKYDNSCHDHILNYRPAHLEHETDIRCSKKYKYVREDGSATVFCHYVDGMEIWDYSPKLRSGWNCGFRLVKVDGKTVFRKVVSP